MLHMYIRAKDKQILIKQQTNVQVMILVNSLSIQLTRQLPDFSNLYFINIRKYHPTVCSSAKMST